jgi:hypothetical protein
MTIPSNAYATFETGSAVMLAIGYGLSFTAFSPASPLGGLLTDRWGPRKTMLGSNVGYLVLMAVALVAQAIGTMPSLLVWAMLLGRVACQSVQLTSLESSVPVLLPKTTLLAGQRFTNVPHRRDERCKPESTGRNRPGTCSSRWGLHCNDPAMPGEVVTAEQCRIRLADRRTAGPPAPLRWALPLLP